MELITDRGHQGKENMTAEPKHIYECETELIICGSVPGFGYGASAPLPRPPFTGVE